VTRVAVISLGSNLGDRLASLQAAVGLLCRDGLDCVGVSGVYETAPVGGPPQEDYLNAVLLAATELSAGDVLRRCLDAETALHRVRAQRWGPRTLDADVIAVGGERSDGPLLTLPHPRAHERAFVLVPWHDIDADAPVSGRGPVRDLLADLDAGGIRRRPDLVLRRPEALPRSKAGPSAEVI
jgi:2-amino-4-hydroxy-6-hydroxymethyldihydropteridine diphosphokinase